MAAQPRSSLLRRFFDVEEITTEIETVTPETVQRLAQQLFRPELMALTLLGNLGPMKITRNHLDASLSQPLSSFAAGGGPAFRFCRCFCHCCCRCFGTQRLRPWVS